jgi:hypothetical protein
MRCLTAAVLRGMPVTTARGLRLRSVFVFRSVHDQVSRSGLGNNPSCVSRSFRDFRSRILSVLIKEIGPYKANLLPCARRC